MDKKKNNEPEQSNNTLNENFSVDHRLHSQSSSKDSQQAVSTKNPSKKKKKKEKTILDNGYIQVKQGDLVYTYKPFVWKKIGKIKATTFMLIIFFVIFFFLLLGPAFIHPQSKLIIKTQPEGAEVFLNGRLLGSTPLTKVLPYRSDQQLSIQKAYFQTHTQKLSVGRTWFFGFFRSAVQHINVKLTFSETKKYNLNQRLKLLHWNLLAPLIDARYPWPPLWQQWASAYQSQKYSLWLKAIQSSLIYTGYSFVNSDLRKAFSLFHKNLDQETSYHQLESMMGSSWAFFPWYLSLFPSDEQSSLKKQAWIKQAQKQWITQTQTIVHQALMKAPQQNAHNLKINPNHLKSLAFLGWKYHPMSVVFVNFPFSLPVFTSYSPQLSKALQQAFDATLSCVGKNKAFQPYASIDWAHWTSANAINQKEYEQFVLAQPFWSKKNQAVLQSHHLVDQHYLADWKGDKPFDPSAPVDDISYYAAQAYAAWLSQRSSHLVSVATQADLMEIQASSVLASWQMSSTEYGRSYGFLFPLIQKNNFFNAHASSTLLKDAQLEQPALDKVLVRFGNPVELKNNANTPKLGQEIAYWCSPYTHFYLVFHP